MSPNPYESPRHPPAKPSDPSPLTAWLWDRVMLVGTATVVFVIVFSFVLAVEVWLHGAWGR